MECTSTARAALREHTECITLLRNEELWSAHFDLWVNGAMLLSPFIPFNIVFCNVVETADQAGLDSLKALVDALDALSQTPRYSSCAKQLRVFKALHSVAAKYVEIKVRLPFGNLAICPPPVEGRAYAGDITEDTKPQ